MPDPMIDDRQRVTGQISYVQDLALPSMLFGKILRSPYPHARLLRIETRAAEALRGVAAVLTRNDLLNSPHIDPIYGPQIKDQPVLALDRVRFVGEPVAAVAAEDAETAALALQSIEVDYEELPAVFDPVGAAEEKAPHVHEILHQVRLGTSAYFGLRPVVGTNICHHYRLLQGDLEEGFARADLVVEDTFRTPAAQHVAMEPHAVLAAFQEGGKLLVYSPTQSPFNLRDLLAEMFHLSPDRVQVLVPTLGGSYGCKLFPRVEPIAAALALQAGRPVKIVLDRPEEFVTLNRHPAVITIRLGVTRAGSILAKKATAFWDTGAYADCGPGVAQKGGFSSVGPYRIPHVQVDSYCVYTNLPPNGAYRGYAVTQVAWASEAMMDEAALALGLDPLEFRLKNILRDGDQFATGEILRDVHFEECLKTAARQIDWQGTGFERITTAEGRLRGKGLSVILKGMTTPSRSEALIEIDEEGVVTLHTASVEIGQGVRTALSQIAALFLGLPYASIRVPDVDTSLTPFDTRTSSSRSTDIMGRAVGLAARDLRRQLLEIAAPRLKASPQDLTLAGGLIHVVDAPDRRLSLQEVVRQSGRGALKGRGEFANTGGLDPETGRGIASSYWHQSAAGVEVEVDPETGQVWIVGCHAAVNAGRVVNRMAAELQTEGCIVMGLGSALFEEVCFDAGQVINPNLSDYMIPSFLDIPPKLGFTLLEQPGAHPHGLGETALPVIPAAVGNAVADAMGVRIRDLPITPERVLRALKAPPTGEAGAEEEEP